MNINKEVNARQEGYLGKEDELMKRAGVTQDLISAIAGQDMLSMQQAGSRQQAMQMPINPNTVVGQNQQKLAELVGGIARNEEMKRQNKLKQLAGTGIAGAAPPGRAANVPMGGIADAYRRSPPIARQGGAVSPAPQRFAGGGMAMSDPGAFMPNPTAPTPSLPPGTVDDQIRQDAERYMALQRAKNDPSQQQHVSVIQSQIDDLIREMQQSGTHAKVMQYVDTRNGLGSVPFGGGGMVKYANGGPVLQGSTSALSMMPTAPTPYTPAPYSPAPKPISYEPYKPQPITGTSQTFGTPYGNDVQSFEYGTPEADAEIARLNAAGYDTGGTLIDDIVPPLYVDGSPEAAWGTAGPYLMPPGSYDTPADPFSQQQCYQSYSGGGMVQYQRGGDVELEAVMDAEGLSDPRERELVRRIYYEETRSGQNVKPSSAGALGHMQMLPATFQAMADEGWDINNPEHNMRAAIRYVKEGLAATGGDLREAAKYYHGGPSASQHGPKTNAYADRVIAGMEQPEAPRPPRGLVQAAAQQPERASGIAQAAPTASRPTQERPVGGGVAGLPTVFDRPGGAPAAWMAGEQRKQDPIELPSGIENAVDMAALGPRPTTPGGMDKTVRAGNREVPFYGQRNDPEAQRYAEEATQLYEESPEARNTGLAPKLPFGGINLPPTRAERNRAAAAEPQAAPPMQTRGSGNLPADMGAVLNRTSGEVPLTEQQRAALNMPGKPSTADQFKSWLANQSRQQATQQESGIAQAPSLAETEMDKLIRKQSDPRRQRNAEIAAWLAAHGNPGVMTPAQGGSAAVKDVQALRAGLEDALGGNLNKKLDRESIERTYNIRETGAVERAKIAAREAMDKLQTEYSQDQLDKAYEHFTQGEGYERYRNAVELALKDGGGADVRQLAILETNILRSMMAQFIEQMNAPMGGFTPAAITGNE